MSNFLQDQGEFRGTAVRLPVRARGTDAPSQIKGLRRDAQRKRTFSGWKLNNLVSWLLDAFPFAARAAAWPGKTFSFVKHIPAHKTFGRGYDQPVPL